MAVYENGGGDSNKLMLYLDRLIAGDYSPIPTREFEDKEFATKFNSFLSAVEARERSLKGQSTKAGLGHERKIDGYEVDKRLDIKLAEIKQLRVPNQEMGASIRNIQNAAGQIQGSTRAARISSDRGMAAIESSGKSVARSTEQLVKVNEQIAVFREKAEKISEIIDMVKHIAKKSGLLALNASIEAARAGEAGRSFAVVANQIKNLSANTTASADDVVKYVEELMTEIEELERAMEHATKTLNGGNQGVQESQAMLKEVFDQLATATSEIDEIFQEIDKQSTLNRSMASSIESIAEIRGL